MLVKGLGFRVDDLAALVLKDIFCHGHCHSEVWISMFRFIGFRVIVIILGGWNS